jgi:hypothetical protein
VDLIIMILCPKCRGCGVALRCLSLALFSDVQYLYVPKGKACKLQLSSTPSESNCWLKYSC